MHRNSYKIRYIAPSKVDRAVSRPFIRLKEYLRDAKGSKGTTKDRKLRGIRVKSSFDTADKYPFDAINGCQ